MKIKLTLFALLALTVIFQSCGDDDSSASNGLDGTWKAQSFVADIESSTVVDGLEISTSINADAIEIDYTLVLDGGNFTTEGSYSLDGQTIIAGVSLPIVESYTDINGSGSYSSTDDMMTIIGQLFILEADGMPVIESTDDPITVSYTIVDDILTITQDEEDSSDIGGATSSTDIFSESVWKRQ